MSRFNILGASPVALLLTSLPSLASLHVSTPATVRRGHAAQMSLADMPKRAAAAPMLETPTGMSRRSALLGSLCLAPTIMFPGSAEAASDSLLKYFPGAMLSAEVNSAVATALEARGYNKANTLFAHSVCSDEVNYVPKELIDLLRKQWGESFTLGGLAGVPFAGKAGLAAYAHHVPDDGKLLIVFAPHVGVGYDGTVGALERSGVESSSSACGAAVGAYKTLSKPGAVAPTELTDLNDLQFDYIKLKLGPKLEGVERAEEPLAFVTYQMYDMVKNAMLEQIAATKGIWDDTSELAVLGGVQINRYGKGDAFQPLMFQTISKSGKKTDLYAKAFGEMPNLDRVVGSYEIASNVVKGGLTLA